MPWISVIKYLYLYRNNGNLSKAERMQAGVVGFTFLKADNKTIAQRYGTTMASLAKRHINGRGICGDARNVVVFWDGEAEGENKWRSFRIEKLISID